MCLYSFGTARHPPRLCLPPDDVKGADSPASASSASSQHLLPSLGVDLICIFSIVSAIEYVSRVICIHPFI